MNKNFLLRKYRSAILQSKKDFRLESSKQNLDLMHKNFDPIFVLTTGRSGSKLIASILEKEILIDSFHEPFPNLKLINNKAFHSQANEEYLKGVFEAARIERIFSSFQKHKKYFESNQCITFFAYIIDDLFPNSKFIHLIRDPADFVLSAYKLGWYEEDTLWEQGRIKDENNWGSLDRIEKLYWLWNQTNIYIDDFKKSIDENRIKTIKSEDLFNNLNSVENIIQFIGVENIDKKKISKLQKKPINNKKKFKTQIPDNIKTKIIKHKNSLADKHVISKYNY